MTQHTSKQTLLAGVALVLTAAVVLTAATANAGPIFFPGKLVDGKYVANVDVKQPCYSVRYSTITTTVENGTAATKIQETIAGPDQAVDVICLVPLPEGTQSRGAVAAAGIPNGDHALLPAAEFLNADKAQKVYETIAQGLDSVEILALSGRPALLVPQFELKGRVEVVVQFRQKVDDLSGVWSLSAPMPLVQWADGPVARVSVSATVLGKQPLRAIFSPTHKVDVEREGLHRAVARAKADNWSGTDDFRLCWVTDEDELGLRVLAYRNEDDEDGYFMLVGNPTGSDGEEDVIDKDVIFVLDTSGSMRGEKIEQARAAIEYCLGQLNPGDRFNIVTFGTEVAEFRDAPVKQSAAELEAAQDFIENVVAKGRTNISGALEEALASEPTKGRPRLTIFLTDGTPTAGELVPEKIVEAVKAVKPCPTRIFVMGVGHDVNAHLLDKLAEATDGSSEYVTPDEEIDAKVAALYDRLSHPVLTGVLVDCGELRTHSVYPKRLPALFRGSEVVLFGRYRDGGRHTLTISGAVDGRPKRYICQAELPKTASSEPTGFVAPLWASRKIGYLLQEIRLHGENEELIAEVVRLSTKFGIVTEYTEFIASANTEVSAEVAVNEARRLMNFANAKQAGQWAFNQARNDQQLQQRMVANSDANYYVDRRGRKVANDNVRQFGEDVFYLRNGQWVDADEAADRKTRVVKLFSDEYNDLVRNNRRFARSQELGWAVSINVGDERIVVEKDGRQQSERLLERQETQQLQAEQMQQPMMQQNFRQFNQLPQQLQNFNELQLRNQLQLDQVPLNQIPNRALNQEFNLNVIVPRQNDRQIAEPQQEQRRQNDQR